MENGGGRAEGDSRMDTRMEPEEGAGLEGVKWGLEGVGPWLQWEFGLGYSVPEIQAGYG